MVNTDQGFVQNGRHGFGRVHPNAETTRHPRTSGESDAVNVLDNVDICFLQSAFHRSWLFGTSTRGASCLQYNHTRFRWCAWMAVIGSMPLNCSCLGNSSGGARTKEFATHSFNCLTTTLERIRLSEVTTAAHVSSADDSMARTVKERAERKREAKACRRGQNIDADQVVHAEQPRFPSCD